MEGHGIQKKEVRAVDQDLAQGTGRYWDRAVVSAALPSRYRAIWASDERGNFLTAAVLEGPHTPGSLM